MDNFSVITNGSVANYSLPVEFPYWQPTLAITLIGYIIVPSGIILTLYLPLLMILLRLKQSLKPLNAIHVSLLASTILEDVLQTCLYAMYLPSIFKYCVCSRIVGTIFAVVTLLFPIYRSSAFAFLAVLQLLVIVGKKKFINLKVACCMISLSIGISLIFLAPLSIVLHKSNERVHCYDAFCPDSRPESGISNLVKVLISITFGSYIPSIIVVIIAATWSCGLFRHYYTGGDDQLNRRMLCFPFVMPLAIIASISLEVAALQIIGEVLVAISSGVYLPNWIAFTQLQALLFFRFITRVTYPLVLVFTHTQLRRTIKKLLKRFKATNSVTPLAFSFSSQ